MSPPPFHPSKISGLATAMYQHDMIISLIFSSGSCAEHETHAKSVPPLLYLFLVCRVFSNILDIVSVIHMVYYGNVIQPGRDSAQVLSFQPLAAKPAFFSIIARFSISPLFQVKCGLATTKDHPRPTLDSNKRQTHDQTNKNVKEKEQETP